MNTEQMRADYEKWVRQFDCGRTDESFARDPVYPEYYYEVDIQRGWAVWQAALNSRAKFVLSRPIDSLTGEMLLELALEHFRMGTVTPTEVYTFSYALADKLATPQQADKVRELEKDAERYRWLCENKFVRWPDIVGFNFDADTGTDEAIDAAMRKEDRQ